MMENSAFRSYEVAERIDPDRSWEKKEPIETTSVEQTGTTEEYFDQFVSKIDNSTECVINEKRIGICSICRRPVTLQNGLGCFYGCLTCNNCSQTYNQRSICRRDVEARFASKTETKVILCIIQGLSRQSTKAISEISDNQIQAAIQSLELRQYIRFPFNSIFNKPKITPQSLEILPLLINTYRKDEDFTSFLTRMGRDEQVVES